MRFLWKLLAAVAFIAVPAAGVAATCSTQAELSPADRDQLASVALRLAGAVDVQDYGALQAALLPAEAQDWESIRGAAEQASSLLSGGKVQLRNLYLLDASTQTAAADTEFFCTDKSGAINVTITMPALPPGRYAVTIADALGTPLAGQIGIILAWDSPAAGWKLGGLNARPGILGGHDGVWYWTRGRALAHADPWSAWYSYSIANYLLIPVDYLTSTNLEKLRQEQSQIVPSPASAFPLTLPDGERLWKVEAVLLDPALREADLGIAYESTGVTDPAALRTEATLVMSALLKAQPGLRANFHGLWAYAVKDGKRTPVMELPMEKIP